METWLRVRQRQLKESLSTLRRKADWTVVHPYSPLAGPIAGANLVYANESVFEKQPDFQCDIFFGQGNSPDIAKLIKVRETGRATLLASWFWDNHHQFAETVKIATLTDVYFPGHAYISSYIDNFFSINGGFMPMVPVPWTRAEVEKVASQALLSPRSDRLYGGYNSHPQFQARDVIIESVKRLLPDNNVFSTPAGTPIERHRFNSLSTADRLLEYMAHKVVLCVPVDRDLTCRMFDALLAGCIPLLVGHPCDLDTVIPRDLQESLPVVVCDDNSPHAIVRAYKSCLELFDRRGADGIMRRHIFTRDNHMPQNRLEAMIASIRSITENMEMLPVFAGLAD